MYMEEFIKNYWRKKNTCMTDKRIGLNVLVDTIGMDYFNQHKNTAVFSTEETNNGLFCFLGIDLRPSVKLNGLSVS